MHHCTPGGGRPRPGVSCLEFLLRAKFSVDFSWWGSLSFIACLKEVYICEVISLLNPEPVCKEHSRSLFGPHNPRNSRKNGIVPNSEI